MTPRAWMFIAGVAATLVVILAALFATGRGEPVSVQQHESRIKVAATIFPLADIVRNVGGEYVDVALIVPPGVSEHSSALTPQQLQDLQNVDVIFQVGHNLDNPVVERIMRTILTVRTVTVDAGIELREFGEHDEAEQHDGDSDPHYWLTVPNAILIADTVAATLAEIDPAHAASYQENVQEYRRQLGSLEAELQTVATGLARKEFIAMHDAWSYFADHYGLWLVATYEPVEGKQPSLADLQRVSDVIEQHGITTFYAEPQKTTSAVTRLLADELGLAIRTLDPVGGIDQGDSYVALMRRNMEALSMGAP